MLSAEVKLEHGLVPAGQTLVVASGLVERGAGGAGVAGGAGGLVGFLAGHGGNSRSCGS